MYLYWGFCMLFLCIALFVRINIEGHFIFRRIFLHTILGLVVFPVVLIPVHELLHIIPYYLTGARKIRIGMDLKQYMFYVTAHRHVAGKRQFSLVAWFPFLFVSTGLIIMILFLPGLWKWSLSLLLFAHCTMCAGDIALLNFYEVNREKGSIPGMMRIKKPLIFMKKSERRITDIRLPVPERDWRISGSRFRERKF